MSSYRAIELPSYQILSTAVPIPPFLVAYLPTHLPTHLPRPRSSLVHQLKTQKPKPAPSLPSLRGPHNRPVPQVRLTALAGQLQLSRDLCG